MKDLHHGLPQDQRGILPALGEEGLDVRSEVHPCRGRKYLEISEQGNINPFPDPHWH